MEQAGYGKEIQRTVSDLPYGVPIQTEEVAHLVASRFSIPYDKARTLVNVKLKRMADHGKISRVQKGVYCHVRQTPFGPITPDRDTLFMKSLTVSGEKRIGYESGASLLNQMGLSTVMPREIEVTTNRWNSRLPKGCHLRLKKPPTAVTNDNWNYLQFLDAILSWPSALVDSEDPNRLLIDWAKKQRLDILKLLFITREYASTKVVLQMIDLFREVKN